VKGEAGLGQGKPRPARGACIGVPENTPGREGFHGIPKEGLDGERRLRIEARGVWRHSEKTPDLQGTISGYRRNPKKYGGKRRDERGDMAQCATPGLTRSLAARVAPAV